MITRRTPGSPAATRAELDALPEEVTGEIVGGVLHTSPRPGGWRILVEPELSLDEDVLVPDIAGWRRARVPTLPDAAAFTIAPDWVCEVASPKTARLDRVVKMPVHARAGVAHLWLVDALAQTLEVFALTAGQWLRFAAHGGDERVRAAPFDAVEIDLARWWDRGEKSADAP